MTTEQLRAEFPYLENGMIYLNHAASGPWSRFVERGVQRHLQGRTYGEVDIFADTIRIIGEARSMSARMIGTDPSRIAFVLNTSEGLNVLASGLPWKSGDRVVLIDQEFPSNIYPFLNLRRLGVEIDFVRQREGRIELEDIEAVMTDRTRLVAVSWVQFLSGFTLDLAAVKAICDRHDALLSVDAIQGLGARQLDVNKVSVDFLSSGVQKWQLGPQGVGIMYVSTKVQDLIRQSHVGWISVQNAWDFFDYVLDLQEDARRYENGTFNAVGISGYHGALSFFEQIGFDEAERRVREITTYTFERAMELGFDVVTPAEEALRAGIVTFRHPQAEEVQKHLQQRKMVVSARVGHVRVSPHFYNLREEVDAVLSSVKEFQLA
mgnify:CR=1 FL=1